MATTELHAPADREPQEQSRKERERTTGVSFSRGVLPTRIAPIVIGVGLFTSVAWSCALLYQLYLLLEWLLG